MLTNHRLVSIECDLTPSHGSNSEIKFRVDPELSFPLESIDELRVVKQSFFHFLVVSGFSFWPEQAGGNAKDAYGMLAEVESASSAFDASVKLPASQIQPVQFVKETVREVVKIPCRYCGSLNLMTDAKCPSCGAPIR